MADIITYPENGITYDADDAAGYLCTRESGVYSAEEDFAVTPNGDLTVTVGAGHAWVRPTRWVGRSIIMEQPETVTLTDADAVRSRIDRIVLRYDAAAKKSSLHVLEGTPDSAGPVAPEITRTALIYDLGLATIRRTAGSTAITAADITDTRADETVCGVMRDGVTGIPTAQITAQARAMLTALQTEVDSKSFYTKAEADAAHTQLQEQISKAGGNVGQAIPVWSSALKLGYYSDYSYQVPENVDYIVVADGVSDTVNRYVIMRGQTTDTYWGIMFESNGNLHGYNDGSVTTKYAIGYHHVDTGDGLMIPQVVGAKRFSTTGSYGTDISVDNSVDYVVAKWLVTDSNKVTVRYTALAMRGDATGSYLTFKDDGAVHLSAGISNISVTYYHYLTSAELTDLQTAQSDTDAMTVDQEYRLTLLELGITDTDTTV